MIKAAAIRCLSGKVYVGRDHSQCFKKAWNISKGEHINATQGFIDNNNVFFGRVEAGRIAWNCEQIKHNPDDGIILSEEIWSDGNCYWDECIESYRYKGEG